MALLRDRHEATFDFEVPGEFLESNLCVCTHDDVGAGFMDGLARFLAIFLPDALHGQTSKLNGLRRSGRRGTNSVVRVGRVPQVGQDGDAYA